MKKSIGIIIIVLALGLAGCQSSTPTNKNTESAKNIAESQNIESSKSQNTESSKTEGTDSPKSTVENENTSSQKNTAESENSNSAKDAAESQNTGSPATITDDTPKAEENTNSNTEEKNNTDTDQADNNMDEENKKQEYINKLDNIELGFKDFNNTEKTTKDMRDHANERYKQWNAALNEIYYNVLKDQVSASEIENLQNEEIQWIEQRDAKAKEDSSKMKGGTLESVLYTNSLAQSTKERCYELVDKYIK